MEYKLYFPAGSFWPFTNTFLSNSTVVASLAPVLHTSPTFARSTPSLRPFREGLLYLIEIVTPSSVVTIVLSAGLDRKSTRLNSSHVKISYAVFCLQKKIRTL